MIFSLCPSQRILSPRHLAGLLLLASLPTSLLAQAGSATISGTVEDPTGAVIPGAKATLIQESTQVARNTVADKDGVIAFVAVPAAIYDVLVTAPGFRPTRENGIAVHINDQLDLRAIVLKIASSDASVTVTTETGDITPTTSGEQSYTLSDKQIQNLNVESRSAIELLDLIPGAANTGNFTSTYNRQQAGFGQNASTYTINGNRFDQVQIVSDGAPVTDLNTAGAAAVTPNVDMISEAKVETSAFSSVQPDGPIVFRTQTKSGGDHFHGEAYLQARNHVFDATDPYTKALGLPKAQSSFYYTGFNIGGPVLFPGSNFNKNHDKLFFFVATEITQQHVDLGTQGGIVPTPQMRQGIFTSAELNALSGGVYRNYYVTNAPCVGYAYSYTPYCTGVTYANGYNGVVNTAATDAGALKLINALFPLPNTNPANNAQGYNLITDIVTSDPRNQENLKLDYNISQRLHLSSRFNHENESVPAPYGPYNTINYNTIVYPAAQKGSNSSNSLVTSLTATLSNTLTNALTVSYTRFALGITLGNQSAVSRSKLSYPYANVYPGSDVLPNVSFSYPHASNQIPGGETPPFTGVQNTTTISDGLTKKLGAHLLEFGFYDVLARYNNLTTGSDNGTIYSTIATYGTYGATGDPTTAYQAINNSTGNEFADLLVGDIAGYTQSSSNVMAHMRNKRFDFYGEDTWKVNNRLTVNYGARLDHIAWWYDTNGLISVFNPSAYSASAAITAYSGMQDHATNSSIDISGRKPLNFEFAPSAGFAFDLDGSGKTILRGGFGTNYYVDPGINAYSAVGAPPNLDIFSYYASSGTPLTLSTVSSISPASNPGVVYGSADPNDHAAPVTYSWNLAVSHIFPAAIHLETSYVGNTTRHLNGYYATNLVPLNSATTAHDGGPYFGGNYYQQLYRPYKSYGDIGYNTHNLGSNYHSLQVTASRSKGWFNTWITYTFGKALGDTCEDSFNHQNCYSIEPFDRSQSLNVSYYILLPDVSRQHLGNHMVVNGLLDGWRISGIEQYGSGTPFTDIPQNGANHNEYSGNQVIGIYGTYPASQAPASASYGSTSVSISNDSVNGTPDEAAVPFVTCDPRKGLKAHQYFNPSCFTAPYEGHNGAFRIPYIHGPAYFNDEIGIFKDFKVRENGKLELRFQGFNFLNRSFDTYLQYDSSLYLGYTALNAAPTNASTAGVTTVRQGHRTIQLAAKYFF
ncbi:Carboxypeptidase regulatory-like domain-containing protein [Bryocella elongata]|uniref:Carboxypeptidase regulatory-like domain-containing protein n=1 Tax=Bryocella elongata TaxID=863522 RepID=A0A1H5UYT9_9BACT|nr:carboxypeptidase-like regulatory domain-containing protein [Bryocella elongata]SEF80144.1 Carboxypeptidase regulatory-like domain-containing protein [Bryocella elongata]